MPIFFRRRSHGVAAAIACLASMAAPVAEVRAQPSSQLKVFKYINGDFRPAGVVFSMTVDCNDPPFSQTVSVASESFAELSTIPVPNTCTITENLPLPAPPKGYQWNAANTPPQPQVVFVPDAEELVVSVFNELIPLLGTTGAISIGKTVVGGSAPGSTFTVQVECASPVFATSIQVPAGGTVVIDDIPAPNTCTITESGALPAPPAGFQWDPGNTPPAPIDVEVAIGDSISVDVTNTLVGVPPPPPPPSQPPVQPVPLAGPFGLAILAVLMLAVAGYAMRRSASR